jgi:CRP-like cAMP-binding protein
VLKYIANLLTISAHKNLILSGRSFHIAPKTIRGRVMAYLNSVSLQKNSREFDIPFDRQQLADYLNLERSALSKELGKMQRDGLISCRKNHFTIR